MSVGIGGAMILAEMSRETIKRVTPLLWLVLCDC